MSEYLGAPNTASSRRNRILQRLHRDRLATLQARTLGIERTSEYCRWRVASPNSAVHFAAGGGGRP